MRRTAVIAAVWAGCLDAAQAIAADGAVEINHASALAGGITSGDGAGYPVTISRAGSYRLTGALLADAR